MLHRRVSILCVREAMRPQSLPGFRVYAKLTSRHQDIHNSIGISSSGLRMVVFWACQHFWDQCVQPFNPAKPEHCRIKTNCIICICLFIHTYVYMYICMYVCMYVCVCIRYPSYTRNPFYPEDSTLSGPVHSGASARQWGKSQQQSVMRVRGDGRGFGVR